MKNKKGLTDTQDKLVNAVALILAQKPSQIKPDVPLHDLGVDSMRLVELLVFIEKTFGLNLMESGLKREHFQTIHSLAGYINRLQNG